MVRVTATFLILASFVSTTLTIMNAFFLKKQFYPSVVYLTKSSTSMAVLYFQAAIISYLVFMLMRWIFFGQLRAAEVEHAQERVWHAIMETCLAFTVFRDDFSPKFVIQFVVLFFVKAFHWLAEDRVDYMERSPIITLLFHARILGIISLLSAVDSYFISHAFFTTLMRGASAQIVFGFEYAVLLTIVAHITINYILHLHDLRSPHPWENKAVFMLYAELFTSFLRCILYLAFAIVMMKIHTFPLFAIRPFYMTVRAFKKAVNDVILSRRAINAMNNLFPMATAQDLAENDNTCIICREEMTVEAGAKKLPCNHIFHPNCLRSWFQRQQTCPTCRTDVLAASRRQAATMPGGMQQQQQANGQLQQPQLGQGQPNLFHPFQFQFHFGQQNQAQNGADQQQQQQQRPPPQFMPGMPPFGLPMMPPQFMQQFQQQHQQQAQQPPTTPMANGLAGGGVQPNSNGQAPSTSSANQQPSSTSTEQPQAQGLDAGGEGTSAAAAQSSSAQNEQQSQSIPPTFQPGPQMPMPPFFSPFMMPMSPFGFLPPPPPPFLPFPSPPQFSGLNETELAEMEGVERQAVEARIQALRNIQVLLDAAMLQFQQYLTAAGTGTTATTGPNPGSSTSTAQGPSTSSASFAASADNEAGTSNANNNDGNRSSVDASANPNQQTGTGAAAT